MPISFLPDVIFNNLTEITPQILKKLRVELLMLDFDNTIVPYTTNVPTQAMDRWLSDISASEIPVCVVSNSKKPRVVEFCRTYGLDCITHSRKPFQKGIRACLSRYDMGAEQAALVGDQIFTDVLGANAAGVRSVLISAIDNHNIWLKLRHAAELPFIFAARRRRYHEE